MNIIEELWSKSLNKRIFADLLLSSEEKGQIKSQRLYQFGFENGEASIPEGNHFRLNSFWLFVGVGNSSKEFWEELPRKDITLGEPHLFEKINKNDIRISAAEYHKQLNNILNIVKLNGYVQERLNGCLSYQYVGNLNVSDLVASSEDEEIFGRTQKDDLRDKVKVKNLAKIISLCHPAFVVANPRVFDKIKRSFCLVNVYTQPFGKLKGEIFISTNHPIDTVFIRPPNHLSRCGPWKEVPSLIGKALEYSKELGWNGT